MTALPQTMWLAFALALAFWIAANVVVFFMLQQVNRNLPIAEHPFPALFNPRFYRALWKQHRSFYPPSHLRSTWLANYAACAVSLLTAFTLLLTESH